MATRKRGRTNVANMQELTCYFPPFTQETKKPKTLLDILPPRPPPLASDKSFLSALSTRFMKPQAVVLDLVKVMYVTDRLPFMTKYQPRDEQGLCDKDLKAVLKSFISDFQTRHSEEPGDCMGPQALMIIGPCGCGKTSAVRAVAKSMNMILLELTTKDQRHSQAVQRLIGEATQTKKVENVSGQSLILLDDVDVIFESEKGFYKMSLDLIKKSKAPIVMTAAVAPEDFVDLEMIKCYPLKPVSETEAGLKLNIINKMEKLDIPEGAFPALYKYYHGNMGSLLNNLQLKHLDLMLGLQRPVDGLEVLESRIRVRSQGANWITSTAESDFEDWLDFIHMNEDNLTLESMDTFSEFQDVLCLYDLCANGISRSFDEDELPRDNHIRSSSTQHKYGLKLCINYLEEIVTRNIDFSKKLVLRNQKVCNMRLMEYRPGKNARPIPHQKAKRKTAKALTDAKKTFIDSFLD